MADDIDPSDLADVFWAFCTRCHPEEHRVYPNEDVPMAHLMGYLSKEEMANLKSSNVIYNRLRPADWTREHIPIPSKFEDNWPKDIQERVFKNWSEYGYDKLVE